MSGVSPLRQRVRDVRRAARRAREEWLPEAVRARRHAARLRREHGLADVPPDLRTRVTDSTFGRRCRLGKDVLVRHCVLGDYSYAEAGARLTHARLGSFCSIAPGAMVGLAAHPTAGYASSHPLFYRHAPDLGYDLCDREEREEYVVTTLGSDVWVGANALVKDGVTVGHGAVLGAGAVVTKDVPAYAVVGGVPARVIRFRFDEPDRDLLLRLAWWGRGEAWLRANLPLMRDARRLLELARAEHETPALAAGERSDA